ncbi:MAG: sigma-54 dependent transcriptional regulator [Desulfarculaceae bacterium]|nr:sigma-54 dependent transcriptional regulator [Desulfarculaceae bacterium]MCF8048398.1 sigma-54 dependent transcriptional regulator [Desulfarculaceae bacterium]MCF8121216.1 sigma-54 dependent transcriptional regulator [Desulfarculaceae bacterium]
MLDYSIFVVDDEEFIRDAVVMNLPGYRVRALASAEEALEALKKETPDLILLDIGLPGMDGVQALGRIKALHPQMLFIMITAFEDVNTVVSAMKQGVYDYVVKPLHMDSLKATIDNALESIRLRKEVKALQERCLTENLPCMVAESHQIQGVMDLVKRVAQSPDAPVLILGETGTGKELIAAAVHYQSPLYRGPLVALNCAALPKDLIESELFGYEPGAFSGAKAGGKKGLVEQAAGGTLFLDEVGDLPPEAQAKLLRFLDSGQYYKIGGTRPSQAQVRVVAATNQDLENLVDEGRFRRDLYFRLGVIKVEVPSLNRRPEDVLPIARHFLGEMATKYGKQFSGFTPEAESLLTRRHYQGNVRELKGLVERGVLVGAGPLLGPEEMGLGQGSPNQPGGAGTPLPSLGPQGLDLGQTLEQVERDYLGQALALAGGNETKAAQLVGMNYHTFRYRKKKLLDGEEE